MVFRICHHAVGGRGAIGQWRRRVSIGEVLAAARRQADLTITQVSQRTRIRETIIRGIEGDDFSACGADFYARGTSAPSPVPRRPLAWSPITSWRMARLQRHGCRPQAGHRVQGRPQAPSRDEHAVTAHGAPRPAQRGDLPDGGKRTLLGRPGHTARRDDLPGHHRPGYLEDLDGTAGSHPEARQPRRGHADRGRHGPHRARVTAGHAETETRSGSFRVAAARRCLPVFPCFRACAWPSPLASSRDGPGGHGGLVPGRAGTAAMGRVSGGADRGGSGSLPCPLLALPRDPGMGNPPLVSGALRTHPVPRTRRMPRRRGLPAMTRGAYLMKLTSRAARRISAAAIAGTVILLPAVALASAGPAATAGTPASGARPARLVTAYVVNQGSGTVTPINTATGKPGKAIKVGNSPGAIAITPNGKTAYVVNAGTIFVTGHTVTPIRTATNTALKPIKVGILNVRVGANAIPITPNGETAYVTNSGGNTVTPINTATNTALKAIKVGSEPSAIAITPDGKTAYVTSGRGVVPINTATNTALKAIKVSADTIAITPDGKTAYVTNDANTVIPINTATNTALKAIKVGVGPGAIAITPDGKTAYVASHGSSPTFDGTVTPINTATNKAGKAIKAGGGAIAITPDGKTIYVTNGASGTVTPIRAATNTVGKAIKVGSDPVASAMTPDGMTAYVASAVSGTVTPINTATNKAGKAIKVGDFPVSIAITP